MHILLITSDYPPQCTSAAVQMHDLAAEMCAQGHKPLVLTPMAQLGSSWTFEELDRVRVLRLNAPRTKDIAYIRRTFAEMRLSFIMLRGLRRSPYRNSRWDLIVWYSPTIFFGPLVWSLKRKSNCRTYLILRDIFPEWAVDLRILNKGLIYAFFKVAANLQYMLANTIGVQSMSDRIYMERWSRRAGRRLEVLQNWQTPRTDIGSSIQIKKTALGGRKIFVYAGNMGVAQDAGIMIDLAERFNHRHDLGFLFIGRGSELARLKTDATRRRLSNILFFDEIDHKEMPGLLRQCYIGLLTLNPRHKIHNIPGKLLTYLLAGLPILARVNTGNDLALLIKNEGVGRVYIGDAVCELYRLAEELLDPLFDYQSMSHRAMSLARKRFSTHTAAQQIINAVSNQ